MTIVRTDIRERKESARRERFEPTGVLTQTNVQKAIEQAVSLGSSASIVNFAASPYTVKPSDRFLSVDTSGGAVTINLDVASNRSGMPITIKDVTGSASTNNITINRNGAETIDSLTALTISADFGGVRLVPISGGYTVDA